MIGTPRSSLKTLVELIFVFKFHPIAMALRTKSAGLLALINKGHAVRSMSTATLPDLPYDYNELSPVIIPEIMELHHKKHHQAYITNLNKAMEQAAEAEKNNDLKTLISLQPAIKFNGGGETR